MPQPTRTQIEVRNWMWLNGQKTVLGEVYYHPFMRNGSKALVDVLSVSEFDISPRPYYIIKNFFTEHGEGYIMYKDEERLR